jgi:ribose/xylose/arabinose/galactoside ABC-type transport system permease subunit
MPPRRERVALARAADAVGGAATALLLVSLGAICLVFTAATDDFATGATLNSVLLSASWLAVLAVGTSLALAAGAIDFSIMANVALTGLVAADVGARAGALAGIVAAVAVGLAVGAANAAVVVGLRVNAFLATLAMGGLLRGVDYLLGHGTLGISVEDAVMGNWLLRDWQDFPYAFGVVVVVTIAGVVVATYTTFGRRLLAVGGNPAAARLSGMSPARVQTAGYLLSGVAAAAAGVLLASRLGAGVPAAGAGQELTLFSAVLIGGTSLWGGRVNVLGSVLAIVFLTSLYSGLVLSGQSEHLQFVVSGVLLVVSVWLVQANRRRLRLGRARRVRAATT